MAFMSIFHLLTLLEQARAEPSKSPLPRLPHGSARSPSGGPPRPRDESEAAASRPRVIDAPTQPLAATARAASTDTRCARYSADPCMSVLSESAGILTALAASAVKLFARAPSIAVARWTCAAAPVTATRTPPAV